MVDEREHRCADCGSTDIDCVYSPHHWHVCFACGHDGPGTTPSDAGAQITGAET